MIFSLNRRIKSVCHQSTFIRKSAYLKYGNYNTSFRYMMDADLLHRFYIKGAIFKYVERDLAIFRQGGVTSDNWRKKLKEYKLFVINNGGSIVLAYYRILLFSLYNIIKKLVFMFLGDDKARTWRYNHLKRKN